MQNPNLLLCVISNDSKKTQRFIDSLISLSYKQKSRSTWGNIYLLRVNQLNNKKVTLSDKTKKVLENLNINFVQCSINCSNDSNIDPNIIFPSNSGNYSIAGQRNRNLIAVNEFLKTKDIDFVGVLDDDIVFENAILEINGNEEYYVDFKITFDYFEELHKVYEMAKLGPIICGNTGCPPIPATSSLESIILDSKNSTKNVQVQDITNAQNFDYYYDLTNEKVRSNSCGAWFSFKLNTDLTFPSLETLIRGVISTRPLLYNQKSLLSKVEVSTLRGGNTYFRNMENLLLYPHLTLEYDDVSIRRSDMIVAEFSNNRDLKYYKTYFPVGHYRLSTKNFNINTSDITNMITAEVFGIVFHRSIQAYLKGLDFIEVWDENFKNRLERQLNVINSAKKLVLKDNSQSLKVSKNSLNSLLDTKYIEDKLLFRNKGFREKFINLMENLDTLFEDWQNLLKKRQYVITFDYLFKD